MPTRSRHCKRGAAFCSSPRTALRPGRRPPLGPREPGKAAKRRDNPRVRKPGHPGASFTSARKTPGGSACARPALDDSVRPVSRLSVIADRAFTAFGAAASAATLTGRVIDPDGRRRARRAHRRHDTARHRRRHAPPIATGRSRSTACPAGRYDVHVVADGFVADPAAVDARRPTPTRRVDVRAAVERRERIDRRLGGAGRRRRCPAAADRCDRRRQPPICAAHQIDTVADALRLVPALASSAAAAAAPSRRCSPAAASPTTRSCSSTACA